MENVPILDGLALLAVVVLGSAFWQATRRIRHENVFYLPLIQSIYTWRRDYLLLTYLILLALLIGVVTFISHTAVSNLTFWLGYSVVCLGQLTPLGQRFGCLLLNKAELVIRKSLHPD